MSDHHVQHHRGGPTHPPTLLLMALLLQVGASFVPDPVAGAAWIVRLLGGVLILTGIWLNVVAARGFERDATPIRPLSQPQALVTDGVFRWTRNPMYLGMASILLGSAAALSSVWAVLIVPVFVARIDGLIRREEQLMEATFGEAYRVYRGSVRRWL